MHLVCESKFQESQVRNKRKYVKNFNQLYLLTGLQSISKPGTYFGLFQLPLLYTELTFLNKLRGTDFKMFQVVQPF